MFSQFTLSWVVRVCLLIPLSRTFTNVLFDDDWSRPVGWKDRDYNGRACLLSQSTSGQMEGIHHHLSVPLHLRWHRGCCRNSSGGPWCLDNLDRLGCYRHPLFPVILIHVYVICVPVPCHGGSMSFQ